MTDDDTELTCEYISDEDGALDLDSEHVEPNGQLVCEATADRVVRGKSGAALELGAIAVCDDHADYLVGDAELDWADNALPLEKYAEIKRVSEEQDL